MPFPRRSLLAAGLGIAVSPLARADDSFPNRPIRFVIAGGPGQTDTIVRLVSSRAAKILGQPIVVDNRPGGGGVIGTEVALRAAGDGYTLLFGATYNLATNVTLVRNLSYDPLRAFSMITRLFDSNWFLVVHPRLGLGSIPELVEYAKRNPGRLNYASFGNGNGSHLAMELFKSMVGARIVHIPYQTPGGAVVDLLAGRTDLAFLSPDSLPHVANGSLKAIGFTGAARSPLMPSVPTMAEAVPGYFYTSWGGVVAPAGVPAPVVSKLNSAYIAALAQNDVRERLRELGAEPMPSTPEAFHTLVRAEIPRLGQLIRNSGVKLD